MPSYRERTSYSSLVFGFKVFKLKINLNNLNGEEHANNCDRHMNGYGSHTFKAVNADNKPVYVKFHFKTDQVNFQPCVT